MFQNTYQYVKIFLNGLRNREWTPGPNSLCGSLLLLLLPWCAFCCCLPWCTDSLLPALVCFLLLPALMCFLLLPALMFFFVAICPDLFFDAAVLVLVRFSRVLLLSVWHGPNEYPFDCLGGGREMIQFLY